MNNIVPLSRALARVARAAFVAVLVSPAAAAAQLAPADSAGSPPADPPAVGIYDSYEFWLGIAGGSPNLGILGITPGQRLAITAFRVRRPLRETARTAWFHTVDFVPLALTSKPIVYPDRAERGCPNDLCPGRGGLLEQGVAYGLGAAPLGMELMLAPARHVELSFGVAGGGLWFDKPVPITIASRFNFTASASAALTLVGEEGRGATVGYRFHHLSNAGLARANPGLASHLVYAGVRWTK
jgi:hypothetical protein